MDRISLLPDCLLHHILAFLTTKVVVQTSLLSRRWEDLWRYMPTLHFSYASYQLLNPRHNNDYERAEKYKKESFYRFVWGFINARRREVWKIDKMTILYPVTPFKDIDMTLFKLLFYFAVSHNVEEFSINARHLSFIDWSCFSSTCQSLKLIGRFKDLWFPLRLDFLQSLEIVNNNRSEFMSFIGEMFSSCPNLESLILRGYTYSRLKITAPKLEYLEIGYPYMNDYDLERASRIVAYMLPTTILSTPKLSHVKFDSFLPSVRWINYTPCLNKVMITFENDNFRTVLFNHSIEFEQEGSERLVGLFNLIQNATSLTMSLAVAEALSFFKRLSNEVEGDSIYKLRHLKLKTDEINMTMPNYILNYLLKSRALETFKVELSNS